jgi:hypothetical protein
LRESREGKLQHEIVKYLQSRKVYFFSVPNEAMGRSVQAMMQLKSMGLRAGVSDMVLVLPGRVVFLEVKDTVGVQSHLQEVFQQRVEELGHRYCLVRSVAEVSAVLDSMGVS